MEQALALSLRWLTVLGFPPAACFLIAHLIVVTRVCPIIGLIPLTASALTGVLNIRLAVRGRPLNDTASILMDGTIALVMFGMLIPSVVDSLTWRNSAESVLATYGICFMWVDFFIHVALVLNVCRRLMSAHCPHCNCSVNARMDGLRTVYPYFADHKPAYQHHRGHHDDEEEAVPRTSMCTSILTVGDLTPPSSDNISLDSRSDSKTLV